MWINDCLKLNIFSIKEIVTNTSHQVKGKNVQQKKMVEIQKQEKSMGEGSQLKDELHFHGILRSKKR